MVPHILHSLGYTSKARFHFQNNSQLIPYPHFSSNMPFGALLALVGVEVTAANLANTYLLTSALVPLFGSALTASGRIVRCKTGPARCHFIEGINDVPMIQNVTIPQTTTPVERSPMRIEHRQVGPCNVPQYNFDMCHNDLKKVIIHTSIPSAGGMKSRCALYEINCKDSTDTDNHVKQLPNSTTFHQRAWCSRRCCSVVAALIRPILLSADQPASSTVDCLITPWRSLETGLVTMRHNCIGRTCFNTLIVGVISSIHAKSFLSLVTPQSLPMAIFLEYVCTTSYL